MNESVPPALDGDRIDRVVALLTGLPRSRVAELVAAGKVLVDGRPAKGSLKVTAGQRVAVDPDELAAAVPEVIDPVGDSSVRFEVVHEDQDVIVVDKPAGLVVHPGAGNLEGTLVQGLLHRFPELAEVGEAARPGLVHRLDKGTSGLMAVARTARAYESLVEQLRRRSMGRQYLALVWGSVESDRGVVDAPIGRSERSPLRQTVSASGRDARTRYEVLGRAGDPAVSLVECFLETGRMHQIRVHLAAIGHPVVGDSSYRGGRQGFGEGLGRPFLHAWKLRFDHPDGSGQREFASVLPPDLAKILPEGLDSPRPM